MKKPAKKSSTKRVPAYLKFKAKKRPLPTNISGWLRAAVEDAKMLEKTPGFTLNMSIFNYNNSRPNICEVCLGGAAIVGHGLVKPASRFGTSERAREIAMALDGLRSGSTSLAGDLIKNETDRAAFTELMNDVENNLQKTIQAALIVISVEKNWGQYTNRASWEAYLTLANIFEIAGF